MRGAISAGVGVNPLDISLSGSALSSSKRATAYVVTATLSGDAAVQGFLATFGADSGAGALLVQAAIDSVPSLAGVVRILNPSLPPVPVAPPGTQIRTRIDTQFFFAHIFCDLSVDPPVAAPVEPPVFVPTRVLDFVTEKQLGSVDANRLRGAIAATVGVDPAAVVLSGSGITGKREVSAFVITATLRGSAAVQAYAATFDANPGWGAVLVQTAINNIASLNGVVTIVNPSLPPAPIAPPGSSRKKKET